MEKSIEFLTLENLWNDGWKKISIIDIVCVQVALTGYQIAILLV